MDAIFIFLGLVVIIIIAGLFLILSQASGQHQASAKQIEGTSFIPSQMFMGSDGLGGLAVNEHTLQICLLGSPSHATRILPITQLLGTFLIHNGEILGEGKRNQPKEMVMFLNDLRHKKESLIKSLHIGGWSSAGNERIDLLVVVHDQDDPILVVNFLDMETKEGGILFEKSMSTARHWHNVLDGIILQADQISLLQVEGTQEKEMAEATP